MSENTNETAPERTPEEIEAEIRSAIDRDMQGRKDSTPEQSFADSLLGTALTLRATQRETTQKVTANRDMLRNLSTSGALTETQASAVAILYPVREKKAKPEPKPAPKTPAGNEGVEVKDSARKPAAAQK